MGVGMGVKWARDLVSVLQFGRCELYGGSMLLPSYVKGSSINTIFKFILNLIKPSGHYMYQHV